MFGIQTHVRCSIFAVLIVCGAMPLIGQSMREVYRADFTNGPDGWYVGQGEATSSRVENGAFIFEKRSESGNWHLYISTFIDPERDYEIEAVITQVSGVDNQSYGFSWGARGLANAFSFGISSNGSFIINRWENNEWQDIEDWTETSAIKPMGSANMLTVRCIDKRWYFLVNGTEVHNMRAKPLTGGLLALTVNDRMTIACDQIVVRSTQDPVRLADGMPTGLKKERLLSVNSAYTDKSPVISSDGSLLFTSRDDDPANIDGGERSDIYVARRNSDGTWGRSMNAGRPLNNEGHNFVVSITPDLNAMVVGNTYMQDGSVRGDGFSYSERTSSGWTVPTPIEIRDYYNRNDYVEACLSPDGNVMLMTIQRDDSYGEKDVYVVLKQENGTWSKPSNLGPTVSTIGNEVSPFLAADGVSLYYSTDGLPGYGNNDIYLTRRLDDTWHKWSPPVNLGPEINSRDWDAYYTIPADGAFAYYCAPGPNGDLDVWRIELPKAVRPKPVVVVSGTVYDNATKKPLAAAVRYDRMSDGERVGSAISDPSTGAYKVVLTADEEFGVRAEAAGFYAVSDSVSTKGLTEYKEIKRDLFLEPMTVGRAIRLNNVFFDVGKADLRDESRSDLDRLTTLMRTNTSMIIEISGHTDDVGKDADNLDLSQRRATAVMTYIVSQNISADRITAKGYGETRPIAANTSDDGRQQNRRVEFTITKE